VEGIKPVALGLDIYRALPLFKRRARASGGRIYLAVAPSINYYL